MRIDLSLVPLYFNADAPLACAMHEALSMNVARLWLRLPGEVERSALDGYFTALGFGEDDDLWPKGSSSFSGYQLLLEYFTFREKFMFAGLRGLETAIFSTATDTSNGQLVMNDITPPKVKTGGDPRRLPDYSVSI